MTEPSLTTKPGLVDRILAIERSVLRLERSAVLNWLSRAALVAAVASNADKAASVFAARSQAGAWSPWSLAIGLELALGISSYALADRVQRNARQPREQRQPALALWSVVGAFAIISTVANVRYFYTNGGATLAALPLAVVFGLAAPAIALANAFLTGDVVGADEARAEAGRERQERIAEATLQADLAAQQTQAELAALQIQAQIAASEASAARAHARAARVQVSSSPSRPSRVSSLDTGHSEAMLSRLDSLVAAMAQESSASIRRLSEMTSIPRSTVNVDVNRLVESGRVRKNGHGWEVL